MSYWIAMDILSNIIGNSHWKRQKFFQITLGILSDFVVHHVEFRCESGVHSLGSYRISLEISKISLEINQNSLKTYIATYLLKFIGNQIAVEIFRDFSKSFIGFHQSLSDLVGYPAGLSWIFYRTYLVILCDFVGNLLGFHCNY